MPTEIFEDGLDVQIGLLAAEPIERGASYPFPPLSVTGLREPRRLRVVIVENAFLRLTLAPSLGGRILGLFDRRTSREILPPADALVPVAGGRRGALLNSGIQLRLDGDDRLNALGNVATLLVQPEDDASVGGVWIAESSLANGLGFHLFVSVPPDRAEVRFEARIANRTFQPLLYDGELAFHVGGGSFDGGFLYSGSKDTGFHLSSTTPFDGARLEGGTLRFSRFGEAREVAPRQVDSWTVTLTPYSGLAGVAEARFAASGAVGVGFDSSALRLQTAMRRPGHKVVLLTQDGQTLEAPVDLHPEHVLEMSLAGLSSPVAALVVLDARREEILRIDRFSDIGAGAANDEATDQGNPGSPTRSAADAGPPTPEAFDQPDPRPHARFSDGAPTRLTPEGSHPNSPGSPDPGSARRLPFDAGGVASALPQVGPYGPDTPAIELRRATFDVATRHLAHAALGIQALSAKNFVEADAAFEQALLYNADDPLLWWEKALAQRLLGNEGELPELLNAHFLAPLEPALRAEAFLGQPMAMGKEPNPLLAGLAENPEDFVEVACLLIERRQLDQAHRWLDEALRHRDLAALRILAAYCLLIGSQMAAEAAEHLRAAAQVAGPPYPWRPVEREALRDLARRFPDDVHVADLIALCAPAF